MSKIIIFAGTTEGRLLAEWLNKKFLEQDMYQNITPTIFVSVATEYGKTMLEGIERQNNLHIIAGRLDCKQIQALIIKESFDLVIDATHPYALAITENIINACSLTNVKYIRLLREESDCTGCVFVESMEKAADLLNQTEGAVLLTTGSKQLEVFTRVLDYKTRIFPRVLPMVEAVKKCHQLGFNGRNIICMQGPFTAELNTAMLRQINAKYLVTKESGVAGGFIEKLEGAKSAGAKVIVIGRPKNQTGYNFAQVTEYLREQLKL